VVEEVDMAAAVAVAVDLVAAVVEEVDMAAAEAADVGVVEVEEVAVDAEVSVGIEGMEEAEEIVEAVGTIITSREVESLSKQLEKQGLVFLGSVSPDNTKAYQQYLRWIQENRHGNLKYLEKNSACRQSAEAAFQGVKTVISFGFDYTTRDPYPLRENETSRVASYAKITDYHLFLKEKAENAFEKWLSEYSLEASYRVCVDTVPLLERAYAEKTGSGFIGKNTCFIHHDRGSFLLLGEILTSLSFPLLENSQAPGCGSCTLCQVECPTGALQTDYQIDSKKCLSYWTIEQRGPIPFEFWGGVGKYWFGCDICQLVCPFNQGAQEHALPYPQELKIQIPPLFEVATMNESDYQKWFETTALSRAKRNGLRRNALIAMTVNQDPLLQKALELAKKDNESPIRETLDQIENYLVKVSS